VQQNSDVTEANLFEVLNAEGDARDALTGIMARFIAVLQSDEENAIPMFRSLVSDMAQEGFDWGVVSAEGRAATGLATKFVSSIALTETEDLHVAPTRPGDRAGSGRGQSRRPVMCPRRRR
jgi:hypothetical protein